MTNLEPPFVEPMLEPAPTQLVIKDIVVGEGAEAPANSTVNVHYLGVEYETGEEFDSSWSRGESIEFPLQRLIAGWQQGIGALERLTNEGKTGQRRKRGRHAASLPGWTVAGKPRQHAKCCRKPFTC